MDDRNRGTVYKNGSHKNDVTPMLHLVFASGGWIAVLLAVALLYAIFRAYRWQRRHHIPAVWYSRVSDLKTPAPSLRLIFADLPQWLFFLALSCFLIAWLDPRIPLVHTPTPLATSREGELRRLAPTEGLAIYLLLDQSGSMSRISPTDPLGPTKLDRLKAATSAFIRERPNDLIGLISFARAATILSPLTLDHEELLTQLQRLRPIADPERDGTGIGYAIFKTVNLITATRHFADALTVDGKPSYHIHDAVIVLVTDGFQSANPMDKGKWMRTMGMEEAAQYAQANHIKLYLVNIEPALSQEEFAPHRNLLEHVANLTGGQFFLAPGPQELQRIYADIDQLERSQVPSMDVPTDHGKRRQVLQGPEKHLYGFFLYAGLLALCAAVILSTTLLRRVP